LDDPGLPLTDAGLAQIVAPSLQLAWLSLTHAPAPTWCTPLFNSQQLLGSNGAGSLLAPTLIHGAALASCWLTGALAARAYERDAVHPINKSYTTVLTRVLQAGCCATGVLILATQLDLYTHFGGHYVQFGDGPDTDFRLQVALVEGAQDVWWEAVTLISWRLFLARQSALRL
jgi:hypothetical protein